MSNVIVSGVGSYLPKNIVLNKDLPESLETSDEWIRQRTGIHQRHIVSDNEDVVSMAVSAAQNAMDMAGVSPSQIDQIIVATCSAKDIFPATACKVQHELGIPPCPAYDIQAACGGFVYALSSAQNAIEANMAKIVLVIGSEAMSKVLDWNDRSTCVLFGDGAGAMVLEASDREGFLATELNADGKFADALYLPNTCVSDSRYLSMSGNTIYKVAVEQLGNIAESVVKKAGINSSDIDWIVPHQANIRIISSMAKRINLDMDKVVLTVDKHANTSTASIPLAFSHALKEGMIKRGQVILLDAFGGGLAWGASILRF